MARARTGAAVVWLVLAAGAARPAPSTMPDGDPSPVVGLVGVRAPGTLSLSPLDTPVLPGLRADLPVVPYDADPEGLPLTVDELQLGGKGWARRRGVFRPYAATGVSLDFRAVDRNSEDPVREWLGKTVTTPWLGFGADWRVGRHTVLTTEMRADVPEMDLSLEALERNVEGMRFLFGLGHRW